MSGDPTKIRVGPGWLRIAPVGSTEPVDLLAAWDASFVLLGYTAEGHSFSSSQTFEPVEVAEEIDPIRHEPTGREMKVDFAMAEMTALNLSRAMNGGVVNTTGVGVDQITTFEPPTPGEEVRVALGWESADGQERWVWRKCLQTGDIEIARRKAPDKATIPASFMCEIVAGGLKPFVALFADPA